MNQKSKIKEENNSWREDREAEKWQLSETDKMIRRELNLSFPEVSQSLSILPKPSPLSTQAEQGPQKLKVQDTH